MASGEAVHELSDLSHAGKENQNGAFFFGAIDVKDEFLEKVKVDRALVQPSQVGAHKRRLFCVQIWVVVTVERDTASPVIAPPFSDQLLLVTCIPTHSP